MNYIGYFLDNMSKANDIAKQQGYNNAASWAEDNINDKEIRSHFWKFHDLRNKVAHGEAVSKNIDQKAVDASELIIEIMENNIKHGTQPTKKEGSILGSVLIGAGILAALLWLFG